MIEIKDLNFSFGKKEILKNINLTIKENEKTVIIGPNGCGKTTLLRLLSGYLTPSSGEIILKNKNLKEYKIKEKSKIIAMMHQNSYTPFEFSVKETVEMGRYPFISWNGKLSNRDKEIVQKSIKLMDIYNLKEKSIKEISGGEKARTMSARAFAQEPEILLMDEPISAMDIKQQINLMNIMEKDEKTFVIVLHDLNIASQYADYIILMKDGELIKTGSPEEVITRENLKNVYEVETEIIEKNHRPFVIPVYKNL